MKKLLLLLTILFPIATNAQTVKTPAFPGAEGFARYTTTGGRGGKVYHVTKLTDDGSEGTLRWAVNKTDRRTIVFDVSGTIYLNSALGISNGNVTIAGQTAPGDGICIADYPFTINASNVILRYLRFRLGNRHVDKHEGDGLGGMDQSNIIVDHCSVSWSVDECLSVYGCRNLTVQWCLVAQSMVNSGHSKGAHGYGGNWGGSGASYHHNLIAHHTSRTPRLGPRPGTQCDERMDMRNNVIYNWGGNGCYGGEGMDVNIVNNYYKPGPATGEGVGRRIAKVNIRTSEYTHHYETPNEWDKMWHVWGHYYVMGNVNSKYSDVTKDNWGKGFINQIDASGNDGTFTAVTRDTIKLDAPIYYEPVTTHTAENAYSKVVDYVGASLARDPYDRLIINDVKNGTAKAGTGSGNSSGFINSQNDVKYLSEGDCDANHFPFLQQAEPLKDTDGDGMPDLWETFNGLNPADASDGPLYTLDRKHVYTNLEIYLNSIVQTITDAGNADSEEPVLEYIPAHKTLEGVAVEAVNPNLYDDWAEQSEGNATLLWGLRDANSLSAFTASGNLKEALAEASLEVSDNFKAGSKRTLSNKVGYIQFSPLAEDKSENKAHSFLFSYKMKDGYTFQPTKINLVVSKNGTNGGQFCLGWIADDEETVLESGASMVRSDNGAYLDYANELVRYPATASATLRFTPYGLSTSKSFCLGDVMVTGILASAAGIESIQISVPAFSLYNLQGQRVSPGFKGIVVKNGKKVVIR